MAVEFRCADVGLACGARVRARTAEELLQKIAAHAADKHGVPALNQTLVDYALTTVRGIPEQTAGSEER